MPGVRNALLQSLRAAQKHRVRLNADMPTLTLVYLLRISAYLNSCVFVHTNIDGWMEDRVDECVHVQYGHSPAHPIRIWNSLVEHSDSL